jgi:hypothetical protein
MMSFLTPILLCAYYMVDIVLPLSAGNASIKLLLFSTNKEKKEKKKASALTIISAKKDIYPVQFPYTNGHSFETKLSLDFTVSINKLNSPNGPSSFCPSPDITLQTIGQLHQFQCWP